MDSKVQQQYNSVQVQSPGTEILLRKKNKLNTKTPQ